MTDFASLIRLLSTQNVECILVGGAAATAHGSARLTQDLDIVYRRTLGNMNRLAECLAPYSPYLRGAPPGLPFRLDVGTRHLVSGQHIPLYLAELDYKYNARIITDSARTIGGIQKMAGKRLMLCTPKPKVQL